MKGLASLFLGLFGTFAFSWIGLTVIPNYQIGHLDPEASPDDENDVYPVPKSGMADRGRQIYTANGCFYCHSQQIRADYAGADIDRKWGDRRSAPRDYIFERPALLGKMRMGPDISNLGKRAPIEEESPAPAAAGAGLSPAAATSPAAGGATASSSPGSSPKPAASPSPAVAGASPAAAQAPALAASPAAQPAESPSAAALALAGVEFRRGEPLPYSAAWHHLHLYSPRSVSSDSNMPAYRFLYEKRRIAGESSADAVKLSGRDAPPGGWEVVPTYEAQCLVAYLMSRDQSHPLKEAKSSAPTGGAPASSPAAAPAASPAK